MLVFLFITTPLFSVRATNATTSSEALPTEVQNEPSSSDSQRVQSIPDLAEPADTPDNSKVITQDQPERVAEDLSNVNGQQSLLDAEPSYDGPIDQKSNDAQQSLAHTDEHSGALIYDYPIMVPPGRNGFQPDFKLSYNSQNSEDGSIYGYGWTDNIPYIERVNKSGLNNMYSTSTSVYFNSSLSGELVSSSTATSTFSSRVDNGEFLNYTFLNNTWTAKDKKGNTYVFGTPDSISGTSSPGGLYSTSLYNDSYLVSYYQMEGNANDSKGSNNGSSTSITYASGNGKYNQGAGFGGSSSFIDLGSNTSTNPSQVTIAFWMQAGDLDTDYVPASKWWSDQHSWVLYIDGSGNNGFTDKIRFNVIVNEQTPSWDYKATSNDALTAGTWYHVVATYDGSTVKMYINGQLQTDQTLVSGTLMSSTEHLKISGWGSSDRLPNGSKIDDFAIFSRALNSTEVNTLYSAPGPSSTEVNGSRQSDAQDSARISKWMLDYVLDPNGNQIKYEYYKSNGQIYPYKISYAGNTTSTPLHTIEISRQGRDDDFPSYKTGYAMSPSHRINQIKVKAGSDVVRQYDLSYTTGDNGLRSMLQSIQESGFIEGSTIPLSLPATSFSYQTTNAGFDGSGSFGLPNNPDLSFEFNDKLADVNGDGLVDYLSSYYTNYKTVNKVYLRNPNGTWSASTTYSIPFSFYYETGSTVNYIPYILADLNGDSLADFATSYVDVNGNKSSSVYLNNGSNWVLNNDWILPVAMRDFSNQSYGVGIAEINGDGLPDLYDNYPSWVDTAGIYLNTGTSWATTTAQGFPGVGRHPEVIIADVNNDSIEDTLTYSTARDSQCSTAARTTQYRTGIANDLVLGSASSAPPIVFSGDNYYTQCMPYERGVVSMDIDGDGITDLFQGAESNFRDAYQGTGKSWNHKANWEADVILVQSNRPTYNRIADLNGDGLPDFWKNGTGAMLNANSKKDKRVKSEHLTK